MGDPFPTYAEFGGQASPVFRMEGKKWTVVLPRRGMDQYTCAHRVDIAFRDGEVFM